MFTYDSMSSDKRRQLGVHHPITSISPVFASPCLFPLESTPSCKFLVTTDLTLVPTVVPVQKCHQRGISVQPGVCFHLAHVRATHVAACINGGFSF